MDLFIDSQIKYYQPVGLKTLAQTRHKCHVFESQDGNFRQNDKYHLPLFMYIIIFITNLVNLSLFH